MKTNKLLGMMTLIVGVMLVFALSGCPNETPPPPQGTWEPANIAPITETWSGNTISFTYNGSPCTLTRNGDGNSLDGVWNGTFEGDTVRVTVSGNNWTMEGLDSGKYIEYAKGTVTASGTNLTIIVTHVMVHSGSGVAYPNVPTGTQISTNGRLTITGLEAYNGRAVGVTASIGVDIENDNTVDYYFTLGANTYESAYYDEGRDEYFFMGNKAKITNGQITLTVYREEIYNTNRYSYSDYSGNDQNVQFSVVIYVSNYDYDIFAWGSVIVNFTNGIGSGTFVPADS